MFFLLFISLLLSQHHCAEIYNISRSQPLSQDQSLVSPRNIFVLGFFRPADLDNKYVGIWHKNISPQKVVWVANREKPIAASDTLASLTINSYGNLELVDGKQNSVWSTNISVPFNSSFAALLDTGNFVVQDVGIGDDPLWQSFDLPCDTFLAEMVMGFDTNSGKRTVLTAWKSESDPSAGLFSAGLSQQTPSQVLIWFNGSTPYWRTGPWDKSKFIGVPDMDNRYGSGFKLAEDDPPGTKNFSFKLSGSTVSYLDLSSEGVLKYMLSDNGSDWWVNWVAPNNTYDTYGRCGVFGVLKTSELPTPKCNCLKGFAPNSAKEWSEGNSTGGCERKTKLFCGSNTNNSVASKGKEDGFWEMKMVKLPDLHELIANMGADECKIQCLNDCACLAYAYPDNIGCLVWSENLIDVQQFTSGGADLFIRLADAELGEEGKPIKLIVILTVIGFISILGAILFGVHRLRANRRGNTKVATKFFPSSHTNQNSRDDLQEYIRKHDGSELSIYNFDSILTATNNFSITTKLGEGGFGPVYQGKLQEGNEIAVKRLSSSSGQGIEEFKNEMLLISKLQHKNLVRIMGCCIKEDEKLLIYEFMPNRSLDTLLFDPKRRSELDWGRRFNIIQGVARGLLYLHHDSRLKVIHRDLKVSNILLDEKMNAKISDFGLARIVQETQNLNTQKVVGTLGYMSPEYAMGGIFSEKSDVYSFGVLLLEIISGRKNTSFYYNPEHLSLLAYAWHLWNDGRGLHLADEVLADSCSESEVMRCMHIGLLCVQDKAADRPTMADVVFMLSSETVLPQAKQPIFTFQNSVSDSQPHKFDNAFSANEASITTIGGR